MLTNYQWAHLSFSLVEEGLCTFQFNVRVVVCHNLSLQFTPGRQTTKKLS